MLFLSKNEEKKEEWSFLKIKKVEEILQLKTTYADLKFKN